MYTQYPDKLDSNNDDPLFYIEFNVIKNENGDEEEHWRLFKRNFLYTEETWKEMKNKRGDSLFLMSREVHPYQLTNGIVCPYPNVIGFDKKEFLKFVVDALNEKTVNDRHMKAIAENEQKLVDVLKKHNLI